MGRRHNTHFIAYGMIIMLALVVMAKRGCFVQRLAQRRPVSVLVAAPH